jgi:5-(carboxyamino)imidazole ribonucleotide mutase
MSKTKRAKSTPTKKPAPRVGIIMGSQSDWPTMKKAAEMLDRLGVSYEAEIVSAHRTPDKLFNYANTAADRGLQVIIAGAGGAAHLPGMAASKTRLPVLGVPVQSKALSGGTLAIGESGAANAGLLAASIVALQDPKVAHALDLFRKAQTDEVLAQSLDDDDGTKP